MHEPSLPGSADRPAVQAGIFPTFFLSGFECSTFLWKDRGRRDLVARDPPRASTSTTTTRSCAALGHRGGAGRHSLADRRHAGGTYDFSWLDPFIAAMNRAPDPADLGPLPLRLSRRCRSVRAATSRNVSRPMPGGCRVRASAHARSAFLHADQRDHLLRLHGRRVGLDRALSARPTGAATASASRCARPISRRSRPSARSIPTRAWSTSSR